MEDHRFLHYPPDSVHVDPVQAGRLPASARRVFAAIVDHGPVTHTDLRALTGMPPRTIRFAVRRLKDERFIDSRCSLTDCRVCYFFVHKRFVDEEALEAARLRAEAAAKAGRSIHRVPPAPTAAKTWMAGDAQRV